MQQNRSTILALAALLATVSATPQVSIGGSQLPSCPGVVNVESSSTVCCVGGNLSLASLELSSCAGWPICTGPVTISSSSTPENPPLTCATVIDMNNPSYSSILAAATSSIGASGTRAATTINPTGPAASPGSTSGSGGASATSTSAASSASAAASSAASSAASNAASASSISGSTLLSFVAAWAAGAVGLFI